MKCDKVLSKSFTLISQSGRSNNGVVSKVSGGTGGLTLCGWLLTISSIYCLSQTGGWAVCKAFHESLSFAAWCSKAILNHRAAAQEAATICVQLISHYAEDDMSKTWGHSILPELSPMQTSS